MAGWLATTLVAVIGLAHALAAWSYFSRGPNGWLWPAGWLLTTAACLWAAQVAPAWGYGLFLLAVALWTLWWVTIRPASQRDWVPENRHQATGTLVGDMLRVRHVRAFDWTSKRAFVERWEERTYDLSRMTALDLFVCTWGDPRIAHTMVAFEFADQPPLCFTIETRREVGERWTPFAGFMKSYELLVIAADERDVVRHRINLRGEDVRLYRIWATPEMRRKILTRYVDQMNALAARPRFYNTIFTNCTTEVARIVWAAGQRFPLDWRLLVSGYVAEFLYDLELLDRSLSIEALKANADIRAKSKAADQDPAYSVRIRDGLADPMLSVPMANPSTTPKASDLAPAPAAASDQT
jgi:hypothetical protein